MNTEEKSTSPLLRECGRYQKGGCVVYRISLPSLPEGEGAAFLQAVKGAFLSFLERESEKECPSVRFGALTFREEEDGSFLFYAAFCPFEERRFRPVFRLHCAEDGAVLSLHPVRRASRPPAERDGSSDPQFP